MSAGIKAFAPASVANVGCGFDILGLALNEPGDYVLARYGQDREGLAIARITGDGGLLPTSIEKNTAGVAAKALLDHLAVKDPIELEIHKQMPFGSGLGSSAASAVASVLAVNKLLGEPLSKAELLPFAILGEQSADGAYHADNVGPSLFGGMILIQNTENLFWRRIPTPSGLQVLVIYPKIEILTRSAREIISDQISLQQHITQSANLAGLILGFMTSDFDLIRSSLKDVVIEPQRSQLIPYFSLVKEAALSNGALGCSISGAGPSIFALFDNSLLAEKAAEQMTAIFNENGIAAQYFLSEINHEGGRIC